MCVESRKRGALANSRMVAFRSALPNMAKNFCVIVNVDADILKVFRMLMNQMSDAWVCFRVVRPMAMAMKEEFTGKFCSRKEFTARLHPEFQPLAAAYKHGK